jgi:hypothetical protein
MNLEPRQLDSAQKAGFVSLLIFALLTISFSFLHLRNTVYGRFIVRPQATTLNLGEYDETVRLQQIDTDKDGLNDYRELYMHFTSPYLADTDSDGIDDATEIADGTDPLCVEGEVCGETEFAIGTTPTSSVASPLLDSASPDEILLDSQLGSTGGGAIDTAAVAELLKDPVQLRQLILNTGKISPENLDQIDDATLTQMAEEMIREYQSDAATSSTGARP